MGKESIAEYLKENEGVHEVEPGEYHAQIWMNENIGPCDLEDMLFSLQPGDAYFYVYGVSRFHRPESMEQLDEPSPETGGSSLPDNFMPLMKSWGNSEIGTVDKVDDIWDPWHARQMEERGMVMPRVVLDTKDPRTGEIWNGMGRLRCFYDAFPVTERYAEQFVVPIERFDDEAVPGIYLLKEAHSPLLLPVTEHSLIRWRSSIHGNRRITQLDISSQDEEISNLTDFGDFYEERIPLDERRADMTIHKYENRILTVRRFDGKDKHEAYRGRKRLRRHR